MPSKNGEPATSFKEATSADITGATETPPQAKNKMGLFISMEDLARSSRATTISFRSKLNNAGHPPSFRQQSARHGTLTEVPYRNRRLVAAAKESKGEALIDKGSLDMTPSSRSAHSETETEAWRPWPLRATVKICRRQSSRQTMTGGVRGPKVSSHKASRLKCSPLARALASLVESREIKLSETSVGLSQNRRCGVRWDCASSAGVILRMAACLALVNTSAKSPAEAAC